ncbi:hypothetical protein MGSAQ_001850 [marine sediment metagenome]|uniref:Uncharacterized protein n=1 Tax=marine sediment metagenome TaxID=412755 RepID=A0A1B6NT56_9ZZZZ
MVFSTVKCSPHVLSVKAKITSQRGSLSSNTIRIHTLAF